MKPISHRIAALALATLFGSSLVEAGELSQRFDIQSQELAGAILQLSQQSGRVVVAPSGLVQGKRAPAVSGEMTISAAVQKLLAGSGLYFTRGGDGQILIVDKAPIAGAVVPGASAPGTTGASQLAQAEAEQKQIAAVFDQRDTLAEIIVTAQKREERLTEVPMSVTSVSPKDLTSQGATQFRDYLGSIPGVSFMSVGAGETQINIRGITTGSDISSTVGIYVDEVPYGSSTPFTGGAYTGLDLALFDLSRIEVLRGPQGTLYGASSLGGLLKYVTPQPDSTRFQSDVQIGLSGTGHGGTGYNVAGVVNVPMYANVAALRISGFQYHDGGYIDNITLGRHDVNRSDTYGGKFDLLITPAEALSIRVTGLLQNISRDGSEYADYRYACSPSLRCDFSGKPTLDGLEQQRALSEPFDQHFRLISTTVNYEFAGSNLTSISSYQSLSSSLAVDQTAFFGPFFPQFHTVGLITELDTRKFTQEIRLASTGSHSIEWLIGGFYTHEKSQSQSGYALTDTTGVSIPNDLYGLDEPSTYEETAAFGDLTWHPSERFDVTGGIRYARHRFGYSTIGSGLLGASQPFVSSSQAVTTYLANARYHFSDRSIAYVRYATGYRPGGPNPLQTGSVAPATFAADTLATYEVGYKAELPNGLVGIDLALYHTHWADPQISALRGFQSVIVNIAGGATVNGAELAVTARPSDRLKLAAAMAYQKASVNDADSDLGAAKDEQLPNVPRFTSTASIDYAFSEQGLHPTLGGAARYAAHRGASFDSSSTPQYRLPAYTMLDIYGGLTLGPVDTQIYIRNITDKRAQLSAFTSFGSPLVNIAQPRTFGVLLTSHF